MSISEIRPWWSYNISSTKFFGARPPHSHVGTEIDLRSACPKFIPFIAEIPQQKVRSKK